MKSAPADRDDRHECMGRLEQFTGGGALEPKLDCGGTGGERLSDDLEERPGPCQRLVGNDGQA